MAPLTTNLYQFFYYKFTVNSCIYKVLLPKGRPQDTWTQLPQVADTMNHLSIQFH